MLTRIQKRQQIWDASIATGDPEEVSWEPEQLEEVDGERPSGKDAELVPYEGKKLTKKRPDFEGHAARLLKRIESMERTHRELTGANSGTPQETAQEINKAVHAMDETVPAPPDEDA